MLRERRITLAVKKGGQGGRHSLFPDVGSRSPGISVGSVIPLLPESSAPVLFLSVKRCGGREDNIPLVPSRTREPRPRSEKRHDLLIP